MRKRITYFICFFVLLAVEIGIALLVHDRFIRPYVGDMLVTVLLCCLVRSVFPNRPKLLAVYIFAFSVAVECLQLADIVSIFHIKNSALRVILGSTFDWKDILCYLLGCIVFFFAETLFNCIRRKKEEVRDPVSD